MEFHEFQASRALRTSVRVIWISVEIEHGPSIRVFAAVVTLSRQRPSRPVTHAYVLVPSLFPLSFFNPIVPFSLNFTDTSREAALCLLPG